jgi:HK97 family phage portal protein
MFDFFGGSPETKAGATVNEKTAMYYSTVFACVRIIAETIASLPLHVYRKLPNEGKERAFSHPLYSVLHDIGNSEMASFIVRETMQAHISTWGNGYAEIEFNNAGYPIALWPMRPDRTIVEREKMLGDIGDRRSGPLIYRYTFGTGEQVILPTENVLHIPGLGFDGIKGYSPIRMARETIGLGLATEEFGARFFGDGTHPGAIVEHPGVLSDSAHKHLKSQLSEKHAGLGKSHRLMLLEEGMKLQSLGIPPEDAQFLETRKFQKAEIAGIYRVPPHMIGDLEKATFSNIEQQSLEFVRDTIRPWCVRWEQCMYMKLLTTLEHKKYYIEHLVDGLLRGDIASRYSAYSVGRQWGWLSADDIREKENMNPLPDEQGKKYLTPLNMVASDQTGHDTTKQ